MIYNATLRNLRFWLRLFSKKEKRFCVLFIGVGISFQHLVFWYLMYCLNAESCLRAGETILFFFRIFKMCTSHILPLLARGQSLPNVPFCVRRFWWSKTKRESRYSVVTPQIVSPQIWKIALHRVDNLGTCCCLLTILFLALLHLLQFLLFLSQTELKCNFPHL